MKNYWLSIRGIVFLISLLIMGCFSQHQERTKVIQDWQKKEIIFPVDMDLKNWDKDSIYSPLFSKYKIIIYVDSSLCLPCKLRLPSWKRFKMLTDSLLLNVGFVFISRTKHVCDLAIQQKRDNFVMPYFYDKNESMMKNNIILRSPELQTFLLDSTNKIVLIGNPVFDEKILKLYLQKMQE